MRYNYPESLTFEILDEIRNLDKSWENYDVLKRQLKALLLCYTPAALLATKAKGKLEVIKRSGLSKEFRARQEEYVILREKLLSRIYKFATDRNVKAAQCFLR